jgi:hypothetical protein
VSDGSRAGRRLSFWLAAQYAAFAGEHAYGAAVYRTPVRLVGIVPLGLLLALALWLLARHARTGGHVALSVAGLLIAVAFVGLAGALEGGFNHGLKLVFHFAGMRDEQLRQIFDGPNFVVPDDVVFEMVGLANLALAIPVAVHLRAVLRATGTRERNMVMRGIGATAMTVAGVFFGVYLLEPTGHVGLLTIAILGTAFGLGLIAVTGAAGQAGRTSRIVSESGTLVPVEVERESA